MKIPIILGTARRGRRSERAAKFMYKVARDRYGLDTFVIDVKDFLIGFTDDGPYTEEARRYIELIKDIDGLIIVTPEYSHGYPGELKILLDTTWREYDRRPLGIAAVSSGRGGTRVVDVLRTAALDLGFVPIKRALYFAPIDSILDEDGNLLNEGFMESVDRFMKELIWYAKVLRWGRENVSMDEI